MLDTFIAEVDEGEERGHKESDTGEREEGEGKEDLDATLDYLGLSHESIGKRWYTRHRMCYELTLTVPDTFIDDVDEEKKDSLEGETRGEAGREESAHFLLDEFGLDEDCAR